MGEASAQFAPFGEADWRRRPRRRSRAPAYSLTARAADGIDLQPLYTRFIGPAGAAEARAAGASWRGSTIPTPSPPTTRRATTLAIHPNAACKSSSPAPRGPMTLASPSSSPAALHQAFDGPAFAFGRFDRPRRFELDLGPEGEAAGDRLSPRWSRVAAPIPANGARRRLRARSARGPRAQRPRTSAPEERGGAGARQSRLVSQGAGILRAVRRRRRAGRPRRRRLAGPGTRLRDSPRRSLICARSPTTAFRLPQPRRRSASA